MNTPTKSIIAFIMSCALLTAGAAFAADNADGSGEMMSGERMEGMAVDSDLTKLPEGDVGRLQPTEIVVLNDGDTYDMEATIVVQEVGNRLVKRLAYNRQIPGPIFKVKRGTKVTINFTNNIDMETAVHAHGLRGDWRMDGAVPITPAVKIGESFSYVLQFPDTGVFWYHPHVREDYQQELGLYGNILVEEEGYWNPADQEVFLILDDILEDGKFTTEHVTNTLMGRFGDKLLINDRQDYALTVNQGEIVRAFITNVANTRTFELEFEGAQMKLVGGDYGRIEQEEMIEHQIIAPAERYIVELYYDTPGTYAIEHRGQSIGTVTVKSSGRDRRDEFDQLRENADYNEYRDRIDALLAAAPDKNLRLDIETTGMTEMGDMEAMPETMNHNGSPEETFKLMGMEMTREQAVEHCKMMPEMAGCEPFLDQETHSEGMDGMMMGEEETFILMGMEMTREQAVEHCQQMPQMAGCEPFVDQQSMSEGMDGMAMGEKEEGHAVDGIEWEDDMALMNNTLTSETMRWVIEDTDTGAKNHEIDWTFAVGDMVKVRVYNDKNGMHPMQHPLHFHGQRFIVLATDGVPNENLKWKDTVLIPTGRTVDLLIDMSNAGKWMAHCHIAEHLESGMMFRFDVK